MCLVRQPAGLEMFHCIRKINWYSLLISLYGHPGYLFSNDKTKEICHQCKVSFYLLKTWPLWDYVITKGKEPDIYNQNVHQLSVGGIFKDSSYIINILLIVLLIWQHSFFQTDDILGNLSQLVFIRCCNNTMRNTSEILHGNLILLENYKASYFHFWFKASLGQEDYTLLNLWPYHPRASCVGPVRQKNAKFSKIFFAI